MSKHRDIKDITITELRAVLNSSPTCLPLRRLEADYCRLVGHPIPFRDMGYNTIEDFLSDIPQVITLWVSNGQIMAKAVTVKSTAHIESLVARQRNRPQATPSVLLETRSREKREPQKAVVPQTNSSEYRILRGRVQGLLYAYPSGMKLSQFMEAFALRFGHYINLCDIGFTSIRELLESMDDIASLKPLASDDDDFIVSSKLGANFTHSLQGLCLLIYCHVLPVFSG